VLTEELGALVGGLAFPRAMRWNSDAAFSRPVRWLLGMLGARALPFAFGPLRAGEPQSSSTCLAAPAVVCRLLAAPLDPKGLAGVCEMWCLAPLRRACACA